MICINHLLSLVPKIQFQMNWITICAFIYSGFVFPLFVVSLLHFFGLVPVIELPRLSPCVGCCCCCCSISYNSVYPNIHLWLGVGISYSAVIRWLSSFKSLLPITSIYHSLSYFCPSDRHDSCWIENLLVTIRSFSRTRWNLLRITFADHWLWVQIYLHFVTVGAVFILWIAA